MTTTTQKPLPPTAGRKLGASSPAPAAKPAAPGPTPAKPAALAPAAAKTAPAAPAAPVAAAKKPRSRVQFLDVQAGKLLTRITRLRDLAAKWGVSAVKDDFVTAVVALEEIRKELQTLPPDFKPVVANLTRGFRPGQTVTIKEKIKASYPEEFHGVLTISRVMGRRVEAIAADESRTMAPFADLQRAATK